MLYGAEWVIVVTGLAYCDCMGRTVNSDHVTSMMKSIRSPMICTKPSGKIVTNKALADRAISECSRGKITC
jgi:hypothetical protein